jgi:SecD/SecF fusion protein
MRNKPAIIVLTSIISILCLYFLSFSLVSRGVQKDAILYATNEKGITDLSKKQNYLDSIYNEPVYNFLGLKYTYKEIKENELNLGLDLQGGMHVTLEVSPVEIVTALSGESKDATFQEAIKLAKEKKKTSQETFPALLSQSFKEVAPNEDKGMARIFSNLANKGRVSKDASNAEVVAFLDKEIDEAIDRTFQILRTRIDKFGVTSPNIQRIQGTGRIQVELPGADNPERVRNLLQGVAKLEFLEVWHSHEVYPHLSAINDYMLPLEKSAKEKTKSTTPDTSAEDLLATGDAPTEGIVADSLASDTTEARTSFLLSSMKSFNPIRYSIKDTSRINKILADPKVKSLLPSNLKFYWEKNADETGAVELVPIKKARTGQAALTGEVITDARADVADNGKGFAVSMVMNAEGARKWKKMTADAVMDPSNKKRVAIVLDNIVYSAPLVQVEIGNGISQITGNFTQEESKDLANVLKAGKLPAPARIVEEGIIGPSLGQEAINQGLISSIAGLALVVLFMMMYYGKGGTVANLALVFNIFFILGILAQLAAALTLPGIAGIVLIMGMSVDANVLIFERIREELRMGRTVTQAISEGYKKAFSSIFDSNLTTAIIGFILFWLGTGPVQGFATTLVVGIFCSFFTSVFISRVMIEWLDKKKLLTPKSFDTGLSRNLFKTTNFNFIGNRKKAYIFSTAIIVIGVVAILAKGLTLGVDFKGGRSYIVTFDTPVAASQIKSEISDNFEGKGTEVKMYGDNTTVKITTSYLIDDESAEADSLVYASLLAGLDEHKAENPQVLGSSKVGATIAGDIKRSSAISIVLSLVAIFIYVLIRFRRWQFSLGSLVALFHDVLICFAVLGVAEVLGFSFELDQILIAALLTVIGYSINDTVVVFDRVRENLELNPKGDLEKTMNTALNDTLSRTVITTLTVLIVAGILFVFGGEVLRGFSLVLLVGTTFGTYSSLFIATPIVLDFAKKDVKESFIKKDSKKDPLAAAKA